jgi:hypothetical protein
MGIVQLFWLSIGVRDYGEEFLWILDSYGIVRRARLLGWYKLHCRTRTEK